MTPRGQWVFPIHERPCYLPAKLKVCPLNWAHGVLHHISCMFIDLTVVRHKPFPFSTPSHPSCHCLEQLIPLISPPSFQFSTQMHKQLAPLQHLLSFWSKSLDEQQFTRLSMEYPHLTSITGWMCVCGHSCHGDSGVDGETAGSR